VSETGQIFKDIVATLPIGSEWYFDVSPVHEEFFEAMEGIPCEIEEMHVKFEMMEGHREKIQSLVAMELHELIQRAKVIWEGRKIFEAYDGFIMNTVSKYFDIKNSPMESYLNQDILFISSVW
jgi:hypothetical protein